MGRVESLMLNAAVRLRVGGRPVRRLSARLDLLRSTGLLHALRRAGDGIGRGEIAPGARAGTYRRLWTSAAAALDAEVVALEGGILEIRRGAARTLVWQQSVPLDDAVTTRLALHKDAVHRLLEEAGLPGPVHLEFSYRRPQEALAFLLEQPGACVVKPARGTGGGDGTTCGVTTPGELHRARLRAGRGGDALLIERQAEGPVYRLLFLEGRLLDVVRQSSPTVEGDGRSTIDELIRAENARRVAASGDAGLAPLRVDLDCVLTLSRAGLDLRSVPAAAERCTVKTVTNEGRMEDSRSARGELCEEIVEQARGAVRAVGLRLAGVDVITADPSRPLAEAGGVIAEVNGMPALHRHHHVADRDRATAVAEPILERLLDPAAVAYGGRRGTRVSYAP